MNSKLISDFGKMIDVNTPIIYIHDYDFARVDFLIHSVIGDMVGDSDDITEWNPATGLTNFYHKHSETNGKDTTLASLLYNTYIDNYKGNRFLILKEIQDEIDNSEVVTLLLLLAQRKLYDETCNTTVIIVSTVLRIPEELKKYISFLEIPLPDEKEISNLIDSHIKVNGYEAFKDEDKAELMPSLKGMTSFEVDRMLDMAMSRNGSLNAEDKEMILQQKKMMVRQSGLLELINVSKKLSKDSIGGLDELKKYLLQKSMVIQNWAKAERYKVAMPKGIFIVGMPGCGKSLCAKVASVMFEVPLLKLDMGTMMGKFVGESEANLRDAIRIAEAAAPCILWIDEIEKALGGVGTENAEILTRMFGYMLGWMQDKESSVYVIATANNAENLPPELKRKGRFDEIFCVNLPNEEERKSILKVKLKERGRATELSDQNITDLARSTKGFNGADIEAVVNESIENCFVHNELNKSDVKLVLKVEMERVAKETISISKSCKDQIEKMQKVFKESSFRDASTVKKEQKASENNKK